MADIAIVAPDITGSIGSVALNHARQLSHWHRIHILSRTAANSDDGRIRVVPIWSRTWNRLHRFCHVPNELSFALAVRHQLLRLCMERRVDVVWCHGHSSAFLVSTARKRCGFRVVVTVHGDIWERPRNTYDPLLTRYYKYVTPRAYKTADLVHILSSQMACWTERGGAPSGKTVVIPNGIYPEEIGLECLEPRNEESFLPSGTLRVLYVGALWCLKGVDTLLRACSILETARCGQFRLRLVGDGPEGHRLRDLAVKLGVGNRVVFVGQVPRKELGQEYKNADVLCVPSLSETFPTVVLEALASGLPVVASRTGGIPGLLGEGQGQWLAMPGDADDLARCLTHAASSRSMLAKCSSRWIDQAARRFSWPAVGRQLIETVDSLLDNGCRRTDLGVGDNLAR